MSVKRPLLGLLTAVILVVILLPIPVLTWLSFFDQRFLAVPPTQGYTLDWYVELLDNSRIMDGLYYSLLIAVIAAAISTIVGVLAAYGTVRGGLQGSQLVQAIMTLPLSVPNIVLSMAIYVFLFQTGAAIGVPLGGSIYSLIAAHTVITIPWTFRLALAGVLALKRGVERASLDLGAGPIQTFLKVSLPLLRSSIFASFLIAFVTSFGMLEISLFLTSPYITTLPVAMMQEAEHSLNPTLAAVSVVQVLITVVMLLVLNRVFGLNKIFIGGSKE